MLPRLSNVPQLNNVVSDYLSELQKQHFEGDIASNYADRLVLRQITASISSFLRLFYSLNLLPM